MLYRVSLDTTLDIEAASPDEAVKLVITGNIPVVFKAIELLPQLSSNLGNETLVEILLKEG